MRDDLVIETARLALREFRADDLEALSQVLSDPETMRFYPAPLDQAEVAAWIDGRETAADPMVLTAAILAGKMRVQDVDPRYPGLLHVQDNVVLAGQGVITQRGLDRLAASDTAIALLRRIWLRELTALAEGRPLKNWRRPTEILQAGIVKPEPSPALLGDS